MLNTLQHAATRCNALPHTATNCNTLKPDAPVSLWIKELANGITHTTIYCNTLPSTATHYNLWIKELANGITHCITLQHTASRCIILQHTTIYCNTLQATATHYNLMHPSRHGPKNWRIASRVASHCNTLNSLHHIATEHNALQHTTTGCTNRP